MQLFIDNIIFLQVKKETNTCRVAGNEGSKIENSCKLT